MAGRFPTKVGYNTAKRRALEALAREPSEWWAVADWARAARILLKRRMYTYGLRLTKYELVERAIIGEHIRYRIRPEGMRRLAWLRNLDPAEITLH